MNKSSRIEAAIKHGLGSIIDTDEIYSGDKRDTVYISFKDGSKFRITVEQIVQVPEVD